MALKYSKEEKSWILYDVGNSAFSLTITTTIYTIFFNTLMTQAGLKPQESTSIVGFLNSFAFLITAILALILGTMADYKGHKKRFFMGFAFLGILAVAAMVLVKQGQWKMAATLYYLSTIGFAGANVFYNAFLLDVTSNERLDRVSSAGFAWGYIGSTLPFLLSLGIIFAFFNGEEGIAMGGFAAAFIITALWWTLFSLPMIFRVKQNYGLAPSKTPVVDSFKRLWNTLKKIRQLKKIFLFLLAYFLYIDGVDTIIVMAMDFGMKNSTLGQIELVLIILVIQFVAWPCTIIYGRLAEKIGTKKMLFFGIFTYVLITLLAGLMESLPPGLINPAFITVALLVGTAQGGIQALSRSYYGSMIPKDQAAEFFGFFKVFGKFAAIFGPAVIGLFSLLMGERILTLGLLRFSGYSLGVLGLLVFFLGGGLILGIAFREGKPQERLKDFSSLKS
ncbi:MAG: MFS transporter [Spirochaetaceae bacterium]|jgi:UMF1 family MFS transporter|nr:MFS transporter [Spirochaetaceae bacterium]